MYPENNAGIAYHTVTAAEAAAGLATVTLGFQPRYVELFNATNATLLVKHYAGMDAGSSLDFDEGSFAVNAADSITITESGFTMGSDIIDTEDDVIYYVAIR